MAAAAWRAAKGTGQCKTGVLFKVWGGELIRFAVRRSKARSGQTDITHQMTINVCGRRRRERLVLVLYVAVTLGSPLLVFCCYFVCCRFVSALVEPNGSRAR